MPRSKKQSKSNAILCWAASAALSKKRKHAMSSHQLMNPVEVMELSNDKEDSDGDSNEEDETGPDDNEENEDEDVFSEPANLEDINRYYGYYIYDEEDDCEEEAVDSLYARISVW